MECIYKKELNEEAKKAQLEKIKEELAKDKQKSLISIETTLTKTWWAGWCLEKDGLMFI